MTKMSYNQQSKLLGGQIGLLKMQLSTSMFPDGRAALVLG